MIQTVKTDPHWEENYDSVSQARADRALAFHYITALASPREALEMWIDSNGVLFI